MIGEEITQQHIGQLTNYICEACSCQVKRQNPGMDFLTNLDWYSYLEGSEVVIDKTLPPLIGMIDIAKPQAVAKSSSPSDIPAPTAKPEKSSPLLRNTALTLGGLILFLIAGTFIIRKK